MTDEERQEHEKSLIKEITRRKQLLHTLKIEGKFSPEIVSNILLSMKLQITTINYVANVITFKVVQN